jgi:hypothetical protein
VSRVITIFLLYSATAGSCILAENPPDRAIICMTKNLHGQCTAGPGLGCPYGSPWHKAASHSHSHLRYVVSCLVACGREKMYNVLRKYVCWAAPKLNPLMGGQTRYIKTLCPHN